MYGKVECALIYIDDDDVPEAVIAEYDGDYIMNAELLTFSEGKVCELITASILDGSASYIPQQNLVHYWGGSGEDFTDEVFSIKDGNPVLKRGIGKMLDDSGSTEYFIFDDMDWWDNHDSITKKEYEKSEAEIEKMAKGAKDLEELTYYSSFEEASKHI